MNFFKLYIGDYQRDTAHLSITEHGAYLLMLQHYYATEKPLPVGKALHRMLRAQDKSERDAIDVVAAQFWSTTEAGLVNGRADVEITKAGAQADTNARIAREREERRKAERERNEQSTNRATNDQPNQTPDTRHQTKPPIPPEGGSRRASRSRSEAVALPTWIDARKAAGEKLIADDDPVFAYAEQIDLPDEYLRLCWRAFRDHYGQPGAKRYRDWRAVFRRCVKGNWLRLWWAGPEGYRLTTQGEQAKRATADRAAEVA